MRHLYYDVRDEASTVPPVRGGTTPYSSIIIYILGFSYYIHKAANWNCIQRANSNRMYETEPERDLFYRIPGETTHPLKNLTTDTSLLGRVKRTSAPAETPTTQGYGYKQAISSGFTGRLDCMSK